MKQYLVQFDAEYYCQGYEDATFQRLVEAESFKDACDKIFNMKTRDWEYQTPKLFKNLSV
jgi:hypothetical protein